MSKFIIVDEKEEIINLDQNWKTASFRKVNVEFKGRNYQVISKYHQNFSTWEKVARILVGFTLTLSTGGILYYMSKTVRRLFKGYNTIRLGVTLKSPSQGVIPFPENNTIF